jgi:hypothetical protein
LILATMMLCTKAPAAAAARRYAMICSTVQVRSKVTYPERDKTKYVMGNTYSMDHDRDVPVREVCGVVVVCCLLHCLLFAVC